MSTQLEPTVFILEDEPAVRDSLDILMQTISLRTECYSTAQEFLDIYDPTRPGCLILDIRLPGMSGLECLEKLKLQANESQLSVIVITGHGDEAAKKRAAKHGAIAVIEKPFSGDKLCAMVQQAIAQPSPPVC